MGEKVWQCVPPPLCNNMISLHILVPFFTAVVVGWPGGSPACLPQKPGHGSQSKAATVAIERKAGSYKVKLIDDHQGLLLQADIEGTRSSGEYRLLDGGTCVTHADTNLKGIKQGTETPVFTPSDPSKTPKFSGWVAFTKQQYGEI